MALCCRASAAFDANARGVDRDVVLLYCHRLIYFAALLLLLMKRPRRLAYAHFDLNGNLSDTWPLAHLVNGKIAKSVVLK